VTTAYPSSFPCASRIEGHSAALSAGLVRTPMEAGNTRQRRTQRLLPHQISLVFMIDQALYGSWLSWVNAHAWDEWITMPLPGLLAGVAQTDTAPVPVRFMTDLQTELLTVSRLWWWRVRVSAEYLPQQSDFMIFNGVWIIGGSPSTPATDSIIGGSPTSPAPIFTNPGTPAAPTVYL
jgi:hypothetical protein